MITTVTLNPAVDKTCTAERLIPGQVNRMQSVKNIAGGKGINVTKVLLQFGCQVCAMGFFGGYTGTFIEESVKNLGAECLFTHVAGETRCNTNILSEDGYVTEVLETGPVISEKELAVFVSEYKNVLEKSDYIVLSGSVPAGVPETIYKDLILLAKEAGKRVLLDSSGAYLKEGVSAVPFMVKPNVKELEVLTGRKLRSREEVIHAALTLAEKGIEHVMVSMGDKGLLYVCGQEIFFAKAPKVTAVNTVGCGDSAVASFVMSMLAGDEKEAVVKRAVAVSAANATTLESAVIPVETMEELYEKIEVERY